MSRIHDSTQVPVTWNQPHAKEQERMALAEQRMHATDMSQDKVKNVAAALGDLVIADRQRAVQRGEIEQKIMGSKIDTFA